MEINQKNLIVLLSILAVLSSAGLFKLNSPNSNDSTGNSTNTTYGKNSPIIQNSDTINYQNK